jgi:RNA polymerase sigma factor (sigma-70 family)
MSPTTTQRKRRRRRAGAPPFESLVERYGPGLLRFCVARLGPDRGEDAFQETLLAALRHYEELRDPAAARSWLFQIAQRKILDTARADGRAPLPSEEVEQHVPPWLDAEPGGGIWRQVAGLPPKQREAIALRYLADLAHGEIAAVMRTSEEAARRNVFEGLKRLRRSIDP